MVKEKPPPPYNGQVVATSLALVTAAAVVDDIPTASVVLTAPFAAAAFSVASLMEQPLWEKFITVILRCIFIL